MVEQALEEFRKKYLTIPETAQKYGFAESTLRRYASQRLVPVTKIFKRVYIEISVFEKWLAEHRIDPV